MGGDGGTLNNTRQEHARARRSLGYKRGDERARKDARSSVTHCALSNERLRNGETVVCRAGQLYNRSSVIEHLLRRTRGEVSDALPHVRKLSRDIAQVSTSIACALTREEARADGSFGVTWACGCVTGNVDAAGAIATEGACAACDSPGARVRIGLPASERTAIVQAIVAKRAAKKNARGNMKRPCHAAVEDAAASSDVRHSKRSRTLKEDLNNETQSPTADT